MSKRIKMDKVICRLREKIERKERNKVKERKNKIRKWRKKNNGWKKKQNEKWNRIKKNDAWKNY